MSTTFFDAHLDQFGPQSGGWGSAEQLSGMDRLSGALRVFFCERDGLYPRTPQEHLAIIQNIREELMPPHMPQTWHLGREFRYHIEGLESVRTPSEAELMVATLTALGVRSANPIYHSGNPLGGCSREPGRGLTKLGCTLITHMLENGWKIDLAHMSDCAMEETIRLACSMRVDGRSASHQICYTHGGIQHKGITNPVLANGNIERCLTLQRAEDIIDQGGIVCLSPANPFYTGLNSAFTEHVRILGDKSAWRGIGIGTDYGGILDEWRFPGCMTVAQCFEMVARHLSSTGLSSEQVAAVVGVNARHFFDLAT